MLVRGKPDFLEGRRRFLPPDLRRLSCLEEESPLTTHHSLPYNAAMQFPRYKLWLLIGAAFGLLSVALGAFGAHVLKSRLEKQGYKEAALLEKIKPWETAAQYQMYHGLALLAVGLLAARRCTLCINLAGTAMTFGTLLFSGCLYGWVIGGPEFLVRFVPIGGALLIVGWACLVVTVLRLPAGNESGQCVE